ncbi:MAG TPA: hypothetical protein VFS08_01090 [Gemmatimonadaceae bacterium]|nr:hypothetical protein [Gemmatimonadaceae bacterium]
MTDRPDDSRDRRPGEDVSDARTRDAPGETGETARDHAFDRLQARDDAPVDAEAVGGVSGLAAGAAIGAAAGGPVGAVIGAAAGALAGVGAARGIEALVNPEEEDAYWAEHYPTRPYAAADRGYEHYRPAYRYGWEARTRHHDSGRSYDEVEPELERDWERHRGTSSLGWHDARHAARDAWHRIERRMRGRDR